MFLRFVKRKSSKTGTGVGVHAMTRVPQEEAIMNLLKTALVISALSWAAGAAPVAAQSGKISDGAVRIGPAYEGAEAGGG